MRANGMLGVHKGNVGQVAGDVPTGTSPMTQPVTLRIVKRGSSIKVFVNDEDEPRLIFRDTGNVFQIGTVGLAALTRASFVDVSYAANLTR